jgi:hypothetical protein
LVGRKASGTSKRTELKLTDVARTSLGELLRDSEIFFELENSGSGTKTAVRRNISAASNKTF